jgi:hypothetical protein
MASQNANVRKRAVQLAQRTKERNARRGKLPAPPRATKEVQALRARAGKPTLDEAFGGVPNYKEFPRLEPLYKTRDGKFSFYFPNAPGHAARDGKFWWRAADSEVELFRAGDVLVCNCRATGDDVRLTVEQAPNGNWQRGPGSTRTCTGDGWGTVRR